MRTIFTITFILLFLSAPGWAQKGSEVERGLQVPEAATEIPEEVSKARFAGAQHEIIAILINEGQYSRVPAEFKKIAELGFAPENEDLLVAEVWTIIEKLRPAGQTSIALEVIQTALNHVHTGESRYNLWMFKGKVFKDAGKLQEAISAFRQAQNYRSSLP